MQKKIKAQIIDRIVKDIQIQQETIKNTQNKLKIKSN